MPVNKRSKYRGSRTCGGGTHKNRRGAGNRGGRGAAGWRDHNFTRFHLLGKREGKYGFVSPTSVDVTVLDIGEIDQMIPMLVVQGIARDEDGTIVLDARDLGIGKVLGGGKVHHKMQITARFFSDRAKVKIEELGGQALAL
ncbi:MAG: 50S ribosomal protein L15 [Methanocalculus sp. MSAO_Arc1]|uniref:uL15m family ribosomal protein n=1 Tax=Methanocalculus TaxID=71151 RepID=UPI000FEE60CF|nr:MULTISPECIES: uL15m family ribosomal protein [unclassified Methanocalculus]MCP1663000.1 large subunit ribosomal protein L15 [Methanocalculus sp. AMF5]RQD80624.1 MAG: 50S ribosomal protein L15 [Methanocalculus sp. MSAO_Arc1]